MARTPLIAFRLGMESRAQLVEMSKLYGSNSVSEFLRAMIDAVCSGDPFKAKAFHDGIRAKAGVQLQLSLKEKEKTERTDRGKKKGGRRAKRITKRA